MSDFDFSQEVFAADFLTSGPAQLKGKPRSSIDVLVWTVRGGLAAVCLATSMVARSAPTAPNPQPFAERAVVSGAVMSEPLQRLARAASLALKDTGETKSDQSPDPDYDL
jgi:hypothetical protein